MKTSPERKAARQPDKIKIQSYVSSVIAIEVPEMKTEDGRKVMTKIQELISFSTNYATEKTNQL